MKRFIENYLIFCTAIILPARSCYGLTIDIDTSQAPQLANFATRVKQALTPWYPVISTELSSPDFTPPDNIAIKFDPNYNGVAVTSGNKIVGSVRYYTSNPDDIGSMIHEMTHVIQSYKSCPVWLTEGIADWIRYYKYEPSSRLPTKPKSTDTYRMGYGTAAYFLQYIIDNTPKWGAPYHLVYWANRNCRSGTYTDSMWSSMTGKTLDQLWQDMIKSTAVVPADPGIYGCYKGYCWSWCSSRGSGNWCYTTKTSKNDNGWVQCSSARDCNENWQCGNECHPKDYTK